MITRQLIFNPDFVLFLESQLDPLNCIASLTKARFFDDFLRNELSYAYLKDIKCTSDNIIEASYGYKNSFGETMIRFSSKHVAFMYNTTNQKTEFFKIFEQILNNPFTTSYNKLFTELLNYYEEEYKGIQYKSITVTRKKHIFQNIEFTLVNNKTLNIHFEHDQNKLYCVIFSIIVTFKDIHDIAEINLKDFLKEEQIK